MAAFSCGKEIEPEEVLPEGSTQAEQPSAVFTYSVSIDASKGADSKALTLEGNTLNATWAIGEAVTVYNETKGEALTGTLTARSAGASTTLKGELSGSKGIAVGDELTLKFLSPNYSSQDGTLEYIAANCDYATASVSVTSVNGTDIRTGAANFVNRQAIVHFELSKPNGYEGLETRSVKLVADNQIITVTLSAQTKDVYVALPAISGKSFIIGASSYSDGVKYYYIKSSASFESGKYYSIPVRMKEGVVVFNETELNSAISDNAPYIVLGSDISLSSHVSIPSGRTFTIDLNGKKLSRSLSECSDLGNVIRISSGGTLTVKDSSGDNSGTISGGRATNGGGICNHGTLTFEGGTITDCMANSASQGGCGGAIFNAPSTAGGTPATLNFTGGVIVGNWGKDSGGIYNYSGSTVNISGGTISGNTSNAGGGGVVNYGTASLTGGTIHNNTATTRGGGIWNGGTLTLGAATIRGNRALIEGGGIHFSTGTATLSGTTIQENTAPNGGGMCILDGATVTLDGSSATVSITSNTCDNQGGALWSSGTINMQGSLYIKDNLSVHGLASDAYIYVNLINCTGAFTNDTQIGLERHLGGYCTSGYGSHNSSTNHFFVSGGIHNLEISNDGEVIFRINNRKYIECSWDDTNRKVLHTVKEVPSGVSIVGPDNLSTGSTSPYWVVADHSVVVYDHIHADNDVHLILCDGVTVQYKKGLSIATDKHLYIYSQSYGSSSMGSLVATGSDMGAGIGSRQDEVSGYITIHGGNITATGGSEGAGIGSGDGDKAFLATNDEKYAGFNDIWIFDGIINATGGENAAGIGSGDGNNRDLCKNIVIFGGDITANGGSYGAGIGGGQDCCAGSVKIYDGTISATGGTDAAGIGTGEGENEVTKFSIYMYGGTVTAVGGKYAAGIGGGQNFSGGIINISGGTVYATGGADGAGIGSGEQQRVRDIDGGKINISGGYVEARGGSGGDERGSGIGGGQDSDCGEIIISGGVIRAYGSTKGAGIGGDDIDVDHLHSVTVNGGDVYAEGGSGCLWTGSIGSYDTDYRCPLTIGNGMRARAINDDSGAEENYITAEDRSSWIVQRRRASLSVCTSHSESPCTWCGLLN